MSMGDAVELHDYWCEHPPTHLILQAVHMDPGARASSRRESPFAAAQGKPAISEADTMQQFFELQRIVGGALGQPREMPAHLKELAEYAEEMVSKMRPN